MRQKRVLRENLAEATRKIIHSNHIYPPHNSLAREETMRATRHVPVTYQVLAHTKTPTPRAGAPAGRAGEGPHV